MTSQFEQFRTIIEENTTFVLTTHISPDGDGLGSEIAMGHFLNNRGKKVWILNDSPIPHFYEFLDSDKMIRTFDPKRDGPVIGTADVVMVLDTNHPDRLGSAKDPILRSAATKIVIDHHLDPHPFADLAILDDTSAATGEILYRLLAFLQGPRVSREIATALYAAIMTDTGSFRFPKTNAELHRTVAALIECGADPVRIYQRIYEETPVNRFRLLGSALAKISLHHGGRVAALTVTRSMFVDTQTSEEDVEQFAPYTLGIRGVRIGIMFVELDDQIKISFRSKGNIAINRLAQQFGGNGHKNAAGARVHGEKLEDVVARVLRESQHHIQE